MDDSSVYSVSESDVVTPNAYVLFYRRRKPKPRTESISDLQASGAAASVLLSEQLVTNGNDHSDSSDMSIDGECGDVKAVNGAWGDNGIDGSADSDADFEDISNGNVVPVVTSAKRTMSSSSCSDNKKNSTYQPAASVSFSGDAAMTDVFATSSPINGNTPNTDMEVVD